MAGLASLDDASTRETRAGAHAQRRLGPAFSVVEPGHQEGACPLRPHRSSRTRHSRGCSGPRRLRRLVILHELAVPAEHDGSLRGPRRVPHDIP